MKKPVKTVAVYLLLTIFLALFNFVYGLFSHGVKSSSMGSMWLVTLGAALLYYLLSHVRNLTHRRYHRLFVNLFNTSVAILVMGMCLRGVIDIAGSSSDYIDWYFIAAMVGFGLSFITMVPMFLLPSRSTIKAK